MSDYFFCLPLEKLASLGCDVSKCEEYKGDMSIIVGEDRLNQQVARNTAIRTIDSCIPEVDPYCGGPHNSSGKGNGNVKNPPSCDRSKNVDCDKQETSCNSSTDPTCKKHKTQKPNKKCDKDDKDCSSTGSKATQDAQLKKLPECDSTTGKYCKKVPFHKRSVHHHHGKNDWIV